MPTQVRQVINNIVGNGGKALLNALHPNEFEYYAVTLELIDSQGKTIDYLTFPVTPRMMDYTYNSAVTVRRNVGGVTALDTPSFVPAKYTISGSFGRNLKILIDKSITDIDSTAQGKMSKLDQGLNLVPSILNAKIKTGYGTLKLLEAIVDKSSGLDKYNKPYKLFLYNPALGHSFLVKVISFNPNQEWDTSNMVWQYQIVMTTIAPLDKIVDGFNPRSLLRLGIPLLQRRGDKLSSTIQSIF